MMLLFLLALSGGFLVRFALGNMLENEIKKTLGIRLLLHSFGLMRNSFSSFPQGVVWTTFTPPSTECEIKCLDCYEVRTLFGSIAVCDCNNYELGFYPPQGNNYCCQGVRYSDYNVPNYCNRDEETPVHVSEGQVICEQSDNAKIPEGGCVCGSEFYMPSTNYYCCDQVLYTEDSVPSECDIGNESPVIFRPDWGSGVYECVSSKKAAIPETGCLCGNPERPLAERNQLPPNVPANAEGLVCGDYTIVDLEQVVMARNVEPAALGLKMDLRAYPGTPDYWTDYGKSIGTVYTESTLDLYDYFGVRTSLITDEVYPMPFSMNDELFTLYKKSEWAFDTLTEGSEIGQGLKGIVDKVYYHCANVSIEGEPSDYCLRTSDDKRGVRCPPAGGVLYPLIIPPGFKLNKTGNLVCEYTCIDQSTFDQCDSEEWLKTACFDFNDLTRNCPGCSCDDFDYEITLCGGDECVGEVEPLREDFRYIDIFTGSEVGDEELVFDFNFCSSDTTYYCSVPPYPIGLSNDCSIALECLENGDVAIEVVDTYDEPPEESLINWDCDSNFREVFERDSTEEQTIVVKDHPARRSLDIRFTDDVVEREYEVLITGPHGDRPPEDYERCLDTVVRLLPFEDYPRSLRVTAFSSYLNDKSFGLSIRKAVDDTLLINVGGVDCLSDSQCNDDNPCTDDECVDNTCRFMPVSDGSYDDFYCFDGEVAECLEDDDCDDNNICTYDICGDGVCVNPEKPDGTYDGITCEGGAIL